MSASISSSCLIKPNKWTLICWGKNRHGNLDIPPVVKYVRYVRMGFDQTCVISNSDTYILSCWGHNKYKQIDIDQEFTSGVRSVGMAGYQTCVLKLNGHLKCQGDNRKGQADIPGVLRMGVENVYSALNHTCVLMLNGKLYCWGETINTTSKFIKPFKEDPKIKSVSMGFNIYAIHAEDQLVCYNQIEKQVQDHAFLKQKYIVNSDKILWFSSYTFLEKGNLIESVCEVNLSRKLICTNSESENNTNKFNISDLYSSNTISIALGGNHVCAMHLKGTVECFSLTLSNQPENSLVLSVPIDASYVYNNIKIGQTHKCTNQSVNYISCTGSNSHNQLEVPLTHVESHVQYFASGYLTSCAINYTNNISCWGRTRDGLINNAPTLINRTTTILLDLNSASLSLTNRHACILTHRIKYCWGWNKYGQLDVGINREYNQNQNQELNFNNIINDNQIYEYQSVNGEFNNNLVLVDIETEKTFVQSVNAGGGHTCYTMVSDNDFIQYSSTYCIGLDTDGQSSVPIGMKMDGMQVQAGYKHSCVISSIGKLNCWGRTTHTLHQGLLDHNQTLSLFIDVKIGRSHTCGLDMTKLVCYGSDRYGQSTLPQSQLRFNEPIMAFDVNQDLTCVINNDGRQECWGNIGNQYDGAK